MSVHDFVGEFVDITLGDQPPVVENPEFVGHAPREGQFLFDQQYGKAVLAVELFQRVADLGHDVRRTPSDARQA